MTNLTIALAAIDAVNSEDPNRIESGGELRPAELVYSERMSAMLARLVPEPSIALQLAVRAQHIRRWDVPRQDYPMDRAGYHRWRTDLKRRHADWTSEILERCGFDAALREHVARLIRKDNFKTDAEAQAVEDCACLVFLAHYADAFFAKHDEAKALTILRKTWTKMSAPGQQAALNLNVSPHVGGLVQKALASPFPKSDA
jgi:Domain of unknown function (DUF4202)